jgi:hypothetical protein
VNYILADAEVDKRRGEKGDVNEKRVWVETEYTWIIRRALARKSRAVRGQCEVSHQAGHKR